MQLGEIALGKEGGKKRLGRFADKLIDEDEQQRKVFAFHHSTFRFTYDSLTNFPVIGTHHWWLLPPYTNEKIFSDNAAGCLCHHHYGLHK